MKLNFCTLFDSNYLIRGLALYDSLKANCPDFHLYIFPFDDVALSTLKELNLDSVTIISLKEFEDEKLLEVKPTRTRAEYCWTCTSSTIRYCLAKFNLPHVTYIDADMIFYSDPGVLIDEMGKASVLLTEHRYTKIYDLSSGSGKYCVQFMFFRNDEKGMKAINWWRDECIKWCYNRYEDGKFGDQQYLDDWTTRFEGVHELKHIGGGVAPWNVQQYSFRKSGGKIQLKEKGQTTYVDLVFFHFHGLKFYSDNMVSLAPPYFLSNTVIKMIFIPYVKVLLGKTELLLKKMPSFKPTGALEKYQGKPFGWKYKSTFNWKDRLHIYKKSLLSLKMDNIRAGHNMLIERSNSLNIDNL